MNYREKAAELLELRRGMRDDRLEIARLTGKPYPTMPGDAAWAASDSVRRYLEAMERLAGYLDPKEREKMRRTVGAIRATEVLVDALRNWKEPAIRCTFVRRNLLGQPVQCRRNARRGLMCEQHRKLVDHARRRAWNA